MSKKIKYDVITLSNFQMTLNVFLTIETYVAMEIDAERIKN